MVPIFPRRKKTVASVQGSISAEKPIKYDVPQGSVLGPLLFILFINDLHKAVEFNRDLKLTVFWIRANKLSLSASKTEIVLFKPRNKKITKRLNFRVTGQKIKQSSQVRYFGVILQNDLHWDAHLTSLEKKLSRSIGLLSKIRH